MNNAIPQKKQSQMLIYRTESGDTKLEVRLEDETVWLTQADLTRLFQTTKQNVSLHIRNIYHEGELDENSTVKEYLTVQSEGGRKVSRSVKYYNLDMIISVGYRIKSLIATRFRQWATKRLREYIVKGFVMDDERLKEGINIGSDYFDELIERIRDIRASEKRFYQKIRDIYKLAVDYDPKSEETQRFFAIVQNKLHFAVSGMTAAEIISSRADAAKANMGLTSWKGDKVRRGDVAIAKNYLNEDEISSLNRIVTMYLDYAEDQANRRRAIYMRDWRDKLDAFLKFNERDILNNPGKVSKEVAEKLAIEQYEIYNRNRLAHEAEREAIEDDEAYRKRLNRAEIENNDGFDELNEKIESKRKEKNQND